MPIYSVILTLLYLRFRDSYFFEQSISTSGNRNASRPYSTPGYSVQNYTYTYMLIIWGSLRHLFSSFKAELTVVNYIRYARARAIARPCSQRAGGWWMDGEWKGGHDDGGEGRSLGERWSFGRKHDGLENLAIWHETRAFASLNEDRRWPPPSPAPLPPSLPSRIVLLLPLDVRIPGFYPSEADRTWIIFTSGGRSKRGTRRRRQRGSKQGEGKRVGFSYVGHVGLLGPVPLTSVNAQARLVGLSACLRGVAITWRHYFLVEGKRGFYPPSPPPLF